MINDLIESMEKLHTTQLGYMRIKRNLELDINNVAKWCKNKIKNAGNIVKRGKNWYVYNRDCIITVNSNSYTIITAHKIKKKNNAE